MISPVNFEEALAVYVFLVNDIFNGEDVVLTDIILYARLSSLAGSGRSHRGRRGAR